MAAPGANEVPRLWERPGRGVGEEITGPDGGTMVWVPPGEFVMGLTPEESAQALATFGVERRFGPDDYMDDEQPAHVVRLTRGFWLGSAPVSVARYCSYCKETGALCTADHDHDRDPDYWGDWHIAAWVAYTDAEAYCHHHGLALPTEAEWEYAARGPEGLLYPPMGLVGNFTWCGAWEMMGECWEWCQDWYSEDYYRDAPRDDPPGPPSGEVRVARGGIWWDNEDDGRLTHRFWGLDRAGLRPSFRPALSMIGRT